ncbi:MAG: HEAT repeat domain-containing protein [Ignavibacteriae bacterium]|nr:HEAT repeat domain-containing protein [Ignavibacteriota bacterium]
MFSTIKFPKVDFSHTLSARECTRKSSSTYTNDEKRIFVKYRTQERQEKTFPRGSVGTRLNKMKLPISKLQTFTIVYILLLLSFFNQAISQESYQKILDSLSSLDFFTRWEAIYQIEVDSIYQALPVVEEKLWLEPDAKLKVNYLEAMQKLGSLNTQTAAHRLIDTIRAYSQFMQTVDTLDLQSRVTLILFSKGDYSTAEYIFQLLHRDSSNVSYRILNSLEEIKNNVPLYSDSVKNELKIIVRKSDWNVFRRKAQRLLVKLFGETITDEIIFLCVNDDDPLNRMIALQNLFVLNYSELHSFLKERLYDETFPRRRREIAESLLTHYGTPSDYQYVSNYLFNESDINNAFMLKWILEGFSPSQPDSGTPIPTMIDSLISIKHQVASYGWLGNQDFIDELDANLDSAKIYILQGDSLGCRRFIKIFQQKVDEEYNDSLDGDTREVKMSGWQFLYWNAEYILNRLPDIPSMDRKEE